MRLASILIASAVLATATGTALLSVSGPARAEAPVIVYTIPEDGQVLGETPAVIQMCFEEPVNYRDKPSTPVAGPSPSPTGDFSFDLVPPDRSGVGMRIVFQPDGYGLAIYPNIAGKPTEGAWTLTYRVTDYEDTQDATEGTITYTVKPGGSPVIAPTPPACTAGDATPNPTIMPSGDTPAADSTPEPDRGGSDGDDGPDILELALYTIGAAGIAAVIALIGYAVRNKIGFWMHRPPERDGSDDHGHH